MWHGRASLSDYGAVPWANVPASPLRTMQMFCWLSGTCKGLMALLQTLTAHGATWHQTWTWTPASTCPGHTQLDSQNSSNVLPNHSSNLWHARRFSIRISFTAYILFLAILCVHSFNMLVYCLKVQKEEDIIGVILEGISSQIDFSTIMLRRSGKISNWAGLWAKGGNQRRIMGLVFTNSGCNT